MTIFLFPFLSYLAYCLNYFQAINDRVLRMKDYRNDA